ncbi:hypothetical protein BaRGS_00021380 [Batillaria attramentaria]|uniref:MD-2-related lipid-recognition domain-containing protein n=1 Tax=Batillaria attramentaria TaxID=370345 RepID=A0ABD0KJL7_9CAEN
MKVVLIVSLLSLSVMAGSAVRTADVKHRPRDLTDDRLLFDFLMNRQPHSKKPSRLSTYQFTNCGDPKKELVLAKLTLSPDPLPSSGTINITFQANASKDVVAPVKTAVTMQKQVSGAWVTVPCVDNIGSCDYADFCQVLAMIGSCPQPFIDNGVPCHCPLPKGNYSLPGVSLDLDIGILPSGGYKAKFDFEMSTAPVGCYEIRFDLD